MLFLKEDTEVSIRCGPFVSPTDGYTAVTNAAPTIYLSKNHGAFAARGGTTWTHDRDGWYTCQLTTTDTSTPGPLVLEVVGASTYLPVFMEFMVVHANVFDSLFAAAATDLLDVNVAQFGGTNGTFSGGRAEVNTSHVSGTLQTARDLGASVLLSSGTGAGQISLSSGTVTVGTNNDKTGYTTSTIGAGAITADAIATGAIDADALATDAVNEIADGVLDRSITEPSGVFTWPATLRTIIRWMGALSRNKLAQSSSTQTLRNDADGADIATASVSDAAGTTTRGEWT